jgi:taurine dioxygenase
VSAFFPSLPDHPCIEVLEGHGESIGTDVWHTDLSWQERPAVATCLHAQALPPVGGDTLWASMTAAYDALSPELQGMVEDLEAEHTWEKSIVDYVRKGPDADERYREQRMAFPPVRHRVVQTHPVTGKRILFVNDLFTTAIHGLPRHEGEALLGMLTGLARVPEYQVRYRWEARSVVVWDNRSVQHYAVTDYAPDYRRLHRVTLTDPAAAFLAVGVDLPVPEQ